MYKIYSRPRIKMPQILIQHKNGKNGKKVKKLTKIILILIITFSTVKLILDASLPIFNNLCENRAKSIATIISNAQATNVMKEHSYEELFSIQKDNDGNIVMIKSNVVPINEIISDIANKIQEEFNKKQKEDVEISMRKFHGI